MQSELEQQKTEIMRCIEREYFKKTIIRPLVIECSVLVSLIGLESAFVSFDKVISNASTRESWSESVQYIFVAFTDTELSIKAISLAVFVVAVLVTRDSVMSLRKSRRSVQPTVIAQSA
jgi:hypothetical protein